MLFKIIDGEGVRCLSSFAGISEFRNRMYALPLIDGMERIFDLLDSSRHEVYRKPKMA